MSLIIHDICHRPLESFSPLPVFEPQMAQLHRPVPALTRKILVSSASEYQGIMSPQNFNHHPKIDFTLVFG